MAGANDSPAESAGANKSPAESAGANKSDKPKKIEVRPEGAVLSPKLAWLGIFISGFLYWIAFPPMDFWPAALFVWFPFRMALEGRTPKQAAKMGIVAESFGTKAALVSGGILCVVSVFGTALFLPKFFTYDGREGVKQKEIEEAQRAEMLRMSESEF